MTAPTNRFAGDLLLDALLSGKDVGTLLDAVEAISPRKAEPSVPPPAVPEESESVRLLREIQAQIAALQHARQRQAEEAAAAAVVTPQRLLESLAIEQPAGAALTIVDQYGRSMASALAYALEKAADLQEPPPGPQKEPLPPKKKYQQVKRDRLGNIEETITWEE